MLGLNVGSGQRRFDTRHGWINVDKICRPFVEVGNEHVNAMPDVAADGAALPFPDNCAQYVVLHHVLEHFGCGEADGVIKEAYRVLIPSGSLLIFLPDWKALATRWLLGEINDWIYFVNLYGAYMGSEEDRHRWGWTPESLAKTLRNCSSWHRIEPFDRRSIIGMDAAQDWWIQATEAVK